MRAKLLFSSGFTLIELLISILVVSILFGLGYANFRRYSQKHSVWTVARQIEVDLRKAQSYAMAGKGSCPSGYLLGYQLRWIGSASYQLRGICKSGNDNLYINISDVSISSSFSIVNFNYPTDFSGLEGIVFYVPKGNTGLSTPKQIIVSLSTGLFPVVIDVSPGGEIFVSEQ